MSGLITGLTFLEKWNTDNTLGTEITIEDQLVKGLKLSFDTQFAPQTGYVAHLVIYTSNPHTKDGLSTIITIIQNCFL